MIVCEGWKIDEATGLVLGRNLEPDVYCQNSAPLYVYNRSVRFRDLCHRYLRCEDVHKIMYVFSCLEDLWQKDKRRYSKTRKYFLSQKLLCKEIARYKCVPCSIGRPIHDRRRLKCQMDILELLFKDFLLIKKETCQRKYTSGNNPNNITSRRQQNFPWQGGTLQGTPYEILEQLMTSRHLWHSNSGPTIQHTCYEAQSSECQSTQSLQPSPKSP